MTTIVSILNRCARKCSIPQPSAWITATEAAAVELRDDFLLETVEELHKRFDWPSPIGAQTVISGDGNTNYALPTNFIRLTQREDAIYETANIRRYALPVTSDGEWTALNDLGTGAGGRWYRIKGFEGNHTIDFYPAPATGESITVSYVSTLWMQSSGGTDGSAFTDSEDVSLFPRRILELGIVWRFRERKGLPFQTEHTQYESWLATNANRAKGIRKISFGPGGGGIRPIKPPAPDFIPEP